MYRKFFLHQNIMLQYEKVTSHMLALSSNCSFLVNLFLEEKQTFFLTEFPKKKSKLMWENYIQTFLSWNLETRLFTSKVINLILRFYARVKLWQISVKCAVTKANKNVLVAFQCFTAPKVVKFHTGEMAIKKIANLSKYKKRKINWGKLLNGKCFFPGEEKW